MGQPRLNISLKPDGVIVREMKKYKVHRPKTFIQISRNKTMVSPKITSSLRKPFYLQSMDLLRYFSNFSLLGLQNKSYVGFPEGATSSRWDWKMAEQCASTPKNRIYFSKNRRHRNPHMKLLRKQLEMKTLSAMNLQYKLYCILWKCKNKFLLKFKIRSEKIADRSFAAFDHWNVGDIVSTPWSTSTRHFICKNISHWHSHWHACFSRQCKNAGITDNTRKKEPFEISRLA